MAFPLGIQLFLLCLFIAPLATSIPAPIDGAALVVSRDVTYFDMGFGLAGISTDNSYDVKVSHFAPSIGSSNFRPSISSIVGSDSAATSSSSF